MKRLAFIVATLVALGFSCLSFAEFDRSNLTHLAALKSEVENDPAGIGYAAVVTSTSDLLALLIDDLKEMRIHALSTQWA